MMTIFSVPEGERGRLLLHIPVGIGIVALIWVNPWLGITAGAYFFGYEKGQDKYVGDRAYIDIRGGLWGLFIAGAVWLGLKLGGIA